MLSNQEVLNLILNKTGCENGNQLAAFLSDKYGVTITRQQVNQFQKSESVTITSLLLREALAK